MVEEYATEISVAKEPAAAVSESAPRISNPPKADRDTSEVREIPLTRGLSAIVDAEDFEHLSKFKWFAAGKKDHTYSYAVRAATKEERAQGAGKTIRMHRVICPPGPTQMVDHINGNTLDNRKSNLRTCSRSQNARNTQAARNAKVKFKGVSFNEKDQVFQAFVTVDDKPTYIGQYPNAMEAALAYDKFAMHIQGEFARLNFPNAAHCEFISKLKAERDALEQIAHVTGEETYRAKAKVWQAEIASLKAERDELRADRDELLERNERQLERLSGNRTIAEMAEAMAERDIALKERDTLRAELSETKAFLDATTGDAMCARAERDEARAECESLRECTRQDDEHIADLERERDRYKAALEYYAQIHESAWHIVSAEPAIEALEGEK